MASNAQAFLRKQTKVKRTKTIPVKLLDGSNVEIDIRELTPQELKRARSKNTRTYPPAEQSAIATTGIDDIGLAEDITLIGMIEPRLDNAELMHSYDVTTQTDLLYELFSINTIGEIAAAIMNLTNEDPNNTPTTNGTEPSLVKEAKNS